MSQTLLGPYVVETTGNEYFDVGFSIPDNCEYVVDGSDGVFTITIKLKKGETAPSTTFVWYKENFAGNDGVFTIEFKQECDNATVTKPKIRVDF